VSEKGEKSLSLNIREVLVLKEGFQLVCYHSNVEQRDRDLVKKLAAFEKEVLE